MVVRRPQAVQAVICQRGYGPPHVEMRPCSRMGRVEDGVEPVAGVAEISTDEDSRERLTGIIRRKYGLEYRVVMGIERLGASGPNDRVILSITHPDQGATRPSRPSSSGEAPG